MSPENGATLVVSRKEICASRSAPEQLAIVPAWRRIAPRRIEIGLCQALAS